jgi:hypothetical protein
MYSYYGGHTLRYLGRACGNLQACPIPRVFLENFQSIIINLYHHVYHDVYHHVYHRALNL